MNLDPPKKINGDDFAPCVFLYQNKILHLIFYVAEVKKNRSKKWMIFDPHGNVVGRSLNYC